MLRLNLLFTVSFAVVSIASISIFGSGCANTTDYSGSGVTQVVEIDSNDSTIELGDGSVFKIDFVFDQNEVFLDDGEVTIVVKFPRELAYRSSSAEINEPGSRDKGVDPTILRCSNGDTYLTFILDDNDLNQAYMPSDGSDAQLKMTLDGRRAENVVIVEAKADDGTVLFGCDQEFDPDEQEVVTVG